MKIVVSACLMGESCKYNGLDNYHRELVEACERTGTEVLLVCPEVLAACPHRVILPRSWTARSVPARVPQSIASFAWVPSARSTCASRRAARPRSLRASCRTVAPRVV